MADSKAMFAERLAALRRGYLDLLPQRIDAIRRACTEVLASRGGGEPLVELYRLAH